MEPMRNRARATRVGRGTAAGRGRLVALAILFATVATGCTTAPTTKAGGEDVRAVAVATLDPQGRPASDDVEAFADSLESSSGGAFDVEVHWEAHMDAPDFDPDDPYPRHHDAVLAQLRSGEAELALLPDWIATDLGVDEFAPLKAPFMVTDDRVVNGLVADPIADRLLGGFEEHGLVGLALLPETMRHPVSYGPELSGPDSYAGLLIRALDPAAVPLHAVLGAEVTRVDGAAADVVVLDGAESAYAQFASLADGAAFVGDVTWYPKLSVLLADAEWFESLDEPQRQWVTTAAARTRDHALATTPSDAESAAAWCEMGGTITTAGPAAVAALEQATAGLRDEVEDDPGHRQLLDTIARLRSELGPSPAALSCAPPRDGATPAPDVPDPAAAEFPDGTYRAELTVEDFTDRGVDEGTAREHAGVWTIGFRDGEFTDPGCPGSTYRVSGDRVTVRLGPSGSSCGSAAGDVLFSAGWEYDGSTLRFVDVVSGEGDVWQPLAEALWGSQGWRRID